MAKRENESGEVATLGTEQMRKPLVIIVAGRGARGKSVFCSFQMEMGKRRFPLRVIDASLNNRRLSERMKSAVEVPEGEDDDRRLWLEAAVFQCAQMAGTEKQHDLLIDMNGGDMLLQRWGLELGFVNQLEANGVELVLIYMVGPDLKDIDYIEMHEQDGVFAPQKTAIVLNAGLVPGSRKSAGAFAPVVTRLKQIVKRDVLIVTMEALPCMDAVLSSDMSFRAAQQPTDTHNFFDAGRVVHWNTKMMPAMFNRSQGGSSLSRWLDVDLAHGEAVAG